jgi:hypothetical protein
MLADFGCAPATKRGASVTGFEWLRWGTHSLREYTSHLSDFDAYIRVAIESDDAFPDASMHITTLNGVKNGNEQLRF